MPVVINEFEVIAEPPPSGQTQSSSAEQRQAHLPALTPYDVQQILEQERERQLRVLAH